MRKVLVICATVQDWTVFQLESGWRVQPQAVSVHTDDGEYFGVVVGPMAPERVRGHRFDEVVSTVPALNHRDYGAFRDYVTALHER